MFVGFRGIMRASPCKAQAYRHDRAFAGLVLKASSSIPITGRHFFILMG